MNMYQRFYETYEIMREPVRRYDERNGQIKVFHHYTEIRSNEINLQTNTKLGSLVSIHETTALHQMRFALPQTRIIGISVHLL